MYIYTYMYIHIHICMYAYLVENSTDDECAKHADGCSADKYYYS